jgi:hypothetical protein
MPVPPAGAKPLSAYAAATVVTSLMTTNVVDDKFLQGPSAATRKIAELFVPEVRPGFPPAETTYAWAVGSVGQTMVVAIVKLPDVFVWAVANGVSVPLYPALLVANRAMFD